MRAVVELDVPAAPDVVLRELLAPRAGGWDDGVVEARVSADGRSAHVRVAAVSALSAVAGRPGACTLTLVGASTELAPPHATTATRSWTDVTLPPDDAPCAFAATETVRLTPICETTHVRWELATTPASLDLPRPLAALVAFVFERRVALTLAALASALSKTSEQ